MYDEADWESLIREWRAYDTAALGWLPGPTAQYGGIYGSDRYDCCDQCGLWKPKANACENPACAQAGMAPCPGTLQHDGFKGGAKGCPACHGTLWVEALDD